MFPAAKRLQVRATEEPRRRPRTRLLRESHGSCAAATLRLRLQSGLRAERLSRGTRCTYLRRLALPPSIGRWSLRSLQVRLIKIGAKVVRHAGSTCFRLAETSVPRLLFLAILTRIRRLLEPVPI